MPSASAPPTLEYSRAGESSVDGRDSIAFVLGAIMLLGFALRMGVILYLRSWENPGAMEHRAIALALINGLGFSFGDFNSFGPTSVQSPPYPFILSAFIWVFGDHRMGDYVLDTPAAYVAIMTFNALIGALGIWLTYSLTRVLGGSAIVALLAAGMCAVWPTQIYAPSHAQAITLITAGTTAIILLYYRSVRAGRLLPWVAFSVIGVLSALTEPVLLPIVALSGLLILACRNLSLSIRLRNAAILLVAALVIIGPWTLRNHRVHGQWIPIKSTFWVNFWKGNNNFATGTDRVQATAAQLQQFQDEGFSLGDDLRDRDVPHQYAMLTPGQRALLKGQPEARREAIFKDISTTWMKAHPKRYVELCFIRLYKTIWIDYDNPKSSSIVYIVSRAVLLTLTAGGLLLAIRQRWSLAYPGLVIGSCLLLYCLTITAARFTIPFEPLQFCLGGLLLATLCDRVLGTHHANSKLAEAAA
ncbi:MAG TPA: hypothetical protein VIL86_00285 [Tepidisphaeraceae bacterium]|jgi:hypothetical protein